MGKRREDGIEDRIQKRRRRRRRRRTEEEEGRGE